MRGLGCEAPRTSSEASFHANWVYSHDIVSRKPRSAVFSFLASDRSSWLVIMKHSGTLVCVLVAASVAAAAAAAAVTAGWWAASAAAWASGTNHSTPRPARGHTHGRDRESDYYKLRVPAGCRDAACSASCWSWCVHRRTAPRRPLPYLLIPEGAVDLRSVHSSRRKATRGGQPKAIVKEGWTEAGPLWAGG